MAGWHHWLDGCEFEWTPGVGDGQGGLACCNSWGRKELDWTTELNWTEVIFIDDSYPPLSDSNKIDLTSLFLSLTCLSNLPWLGEKKKKDHLITKITPYVFSKHFFISRDAITIHPVVWDENLGVILNFHLFSFLLPSLLDSILNAKLKSISFSCPATTNELKLKCFSH